MVGRRVCEWQFRGILWNSWVNQGHIRLAREVMQWDALREPEEKHGSGQSHDYNEIFQAWFNDVTAEDYSKAGGLALDLSLTNYIDTGKAAKTEKEKEEELAGQVKAMPQSTEEYQKELVRVLEWAKNKGHAFTYVEPWNEPNDQGEMKGTLRTTREAEENKPSRYTPATAAKYTQAAEEACKYYGCTVIAGNVYANGSGASAKWENEYEEE